jgi:hypothetical protein
VDGEALDRCLPPLLLLELEQQLLEQLAIVSEVQSTDGLGEATERP